PPVPATGLRDAASQRWRRRRSVREGAGPDSDRTQRAREGAVSRIESKESGEFPMRLDKLTVKAQEAVQAAQSLADQHNHQAIEPEHVLLALLQQQEGIVGPLLAKLGARSDNVLRQVEAELGKLPKVRGDGGRQYASPRFESVVDRAWDEAQRLKD